MPEYTFKLVKKFQSFDDISSRQFAKRIVDNLKKTYPEMEFEVKLTQHGATENIWKRNSQTVGI